MVGSTSFSGNGLRDWLLQRFSAIVIGAYAIYLLLYACCHHTITYQMWHHLFSSVWMQIFSTVVLLSVLIHAWIGLWTVFTDYVKVTWLRMTLLGLLLVGLLSYVAWGLWIIW